MKKGIVVALIVALAVAAFVPVEVGARIHRIQSKVTLKNFEPTLYEGAVKSKWEDCEKRRLVKVFHDEDEDGADPSDYLIGKGRTDGEGKYEIEGNQAPEGDDIVAKVSRKTLASDQICLGGEVSAVALTG